MLARRFATLDQLSRGRVVVGLGQGWLAEEFETANVSLRRRGAGMDEFLVALRACWGPDPVHFAGQFYRIAESAIGPKPLQAGGPPVLLAVASRAALVRAVRLADGINPIAQDWRWLEWVLRTYRDLGREAGRGPRRMQIVARSNHPISQHALPDPRPSLSGSIDQVREDAHRLTELGADHLFFDLAPLPLEEQLRLLAPLRAVVT